MGIFIFVVPHGSKDFICEKMKEYCDKMKIRINYINHIKNEFVKSNICEKFYIFGKIVYIIRTVKPFDEWTRDLDEIHNVLESHWLNGVLFHKTQSSQLPLSPPPAPAPP